MMSGKNTHEHTLQIEIIHGRRKKAEGSGEITHESEWEPVAAFSLDQALLIWRVF